MPEQNVTQCYNTYVTKYTSSVREKCEDVFVKTCRIVQRSRAYNHTVRMCKRPLVKDCSPQSSVSDCLFVCLFVCSHIYENLFIAVTNIQWRLRCPWLRSPASSHPPSCPGVQGPPRDRLQHLRPHRPPGRHTPLLRLETDRDRFFHPLKSKFQRICVCRACSVCEVKLQCLEYGLSRAFVVSGLSVVLVSGLSGVVVSVVSGV